MFDNSSNISQCDFANVCPKVPLFESENFEFEGVVPFNISADCPQVSVKGKLFLIDLKINWTLAASRCSRL